MEMPQDKIVQFTSSAMEALKRAYEECPNSTAGSFIIIAFNAMIRLENELDQGNTLLGLNPVGSGNFQNDFKAAA
jgi:hypothetical protein